MPEWNLAGPRYKYPVSSAELERRLSAVQAAMRDKGLDCCIAQTQSTIFDSITRYLTDSAANPYSTTLLIPAQGGLVLINHGVEMDPAPIPPTLRNVEKLIRKPYCQPFGCTDGMIGAVLSREIRSRGFRRIGVILRQLMSADTLEGVREGVPGCELVDFTAEFSRIKAVKSPEEWALIDRCLRAHEQLMAMVPALLRPGRMEYEVLADLEHASRYLCCDWLGNVAVGSAPGGGGVPFHQNPAANRRIERGDGVTVMIEVSGPGGIYGELARTFCLGEPAPALLELYETARDVQHAVAAAARPGVTGRELNEVFDDFVTARGIAKNGRFAGHGQGYDMMEAPVICPQEEMALEEGMFLAIHPELMRDGQFSICCDNFRVAAGGAERLTRTEQKIFALEF